MGKPKQIGKSHQYPSQRKSYTTSRAGVGGRKKKDEIKKKPAATYFDKLKAQQRTTISGKFIFKFSYKFSLVNLRTWVILKRLFVSCNP